MRIDSLTIAAAQRKATETLSIPFIQKMKVENGQHVEDGPPKANPFYVPGIDVTSPVVLVQEQPWTNAIQQFPFDFSIKGPGPSTTLNNNVLPKNNFAAIYGIQMWFGVGANANNRTYRSSGFSSSDDSIYNSIIQMKIEQATMIDILEGQLFKDTYQSPGMVDQTSGLVLINPIRVLSGEYGIFQMFINLKNSISTLVLTPGMFVSMRLHAVMGQASGK
jgi:hypothetical protein